jgi:hypothetical protein
VKARNWMALILGTVVSLAAAYGAYNLANYSWNQVVDYRSPYVQAMLPDGPAARPDDPVRAKRVVFVIVDGLREDVSRQMATMQQLRKSGFDAVVRTGEPSLSFPNWTTLLSGAPQRISGVTTNWFEEQVPVETLVDVALRVKRPVIVSAPKDFEMLYGVERADHVFLKDWTADSYMSAEIVDNAIRLARETSPTLAIIHLPDIDEAGHAFGGSSPEYLASAKKVDVDLGRLVAALQDGDTVFVVASDHGHIATGGHGGWEPDVIEVPAVFAGSGVKFGEGTGDQDQVPATVALLAGLPAPKNGIGTPLGVTVDRPDVSRFDAQRMAAFVSYAEVIRDALPEAEKAAKPATTPEKAQAAFEAVTQDGLVFERGQRLPQALGLLLASVAIAAAVGLMSWRALAAAGAGTLFYYIVYDGLFFVLHGYRWSLSAFNSEDLLKAFFNARMIEALIAAAVACFVAAEVYLASRPVPERPKGQYFSGWLALGAATILVIQASLGLQVAWYLWWYGVPITWVLPDFLWAFKYDLDLIQMTALGAAVLGAPLITYLVGRFHPIRAVAPAEEDEYAEWNGSDSYEEA